MTRRRLLNALVPTLVIGLFAAFGAVVTASTATAAQASLGSLTLSPASGADTDLITVATVSTAVAKGCPAGATTITGRIVGPGVWATGFDTFPATSTTAAAAASGELAVTLSGSLSSIATAHQVAIAIGTYQIAISCTDAAATSYGAFTASLSFSSSTHYDMVTTAPLAASDTPTPSPTTSATPSPSPSQSPTPSPSASPTATPSPTATASTTPTPSASVTATPTPSAQPNLGKLTFLPATGDNTTSLTLNTVSSGSQKGCPTGTTSVGAVIVGPGNWAPGIIAFGRQASGISTTADFGVQLGGMATIASANSAPLVAGRYDVTMSCQTGTIATTQKVGAFSGSIWFTDATHFQSTDPATTQTQTTTAITVVPQYRVDLGAEITLTATVTPATAVGKLQFQEDQSGAFATIGSPLDLTNGTATLKISTLPFGLHQISAVFLPTDDKKFKTSTSPAFVEVVAKSIPPLPPSAATLTGTAKVGSTLTCAGTFQNATSTSWAWLRNRAPISGATASTYKLVAADKGTAVQCQALATNAGGTTSRTSRAVAVS